MNEYNIIDGEKCCWRCGISKKDALRTSGCYIGYGKYSFHMWKATNLQEGPDAFERQGL